MYFYFIYQFRIMHYWDVMDSFLLMLGIDVPSRRYYWSMENLLKGCDHNRILFHYQCIIYPYHF